MTERVFSRFHCVHTLPVQRKKEAEKTSELASASKDKVLGGHRKRDCSQCARERVVHTVHTLRESEKEACGEPRVCAASGSWQLQPPVFQHGCLGFGCSPFCSALLCQLCAHCQERSVNHRDHLDPRDPDAHRPGSVALYLREVEEVRCGGEFFCNRNPLRTQTSFKEELLFVRSLFRRLMWMTTGTLASSARRQRR
jgi:hypothetical protein